MKALGARLEQLEQAQPTSDKPIKIIYQDGDRYWTGSKTYFGDDRVFLTPRQRERMEDDYNVINVCYVDNWREGLEGENVT